MITIRRSASVLLLFIPGLVAQAAVTDFRTWTPVEDPDHPGFSGFVSVDGTSATLSAIDLPIPAGTDIGFQSVTGSTPGTSTSGFFFRPTEDFSLAIDYAWSFSNNPTGFLGLGFGIGEDGDGRNSAGVAMGTSGGDPLGPFGGAARVGNVDEPLLSLGNPFLDTSTLSGTLFVEYQSSSGDVIVGAAPTPGAAAPVFSGSFDGIQKRWSGGNLMTSFFIRSDAPPLTNAWSGGEANAVLSNFRVLGGNPVAIPEPSAALVSMGLVGMLLLSRSRRRRNRRLDERI